MRVVVDSADLLIAEDFNGSPVTVVTFTGKGRCIAGLPVREFHTSLTAASRPLNIISVIDRKRCWYNNGLTVEIARAVNAILDRDGLRRTITLGTSMGGYGAMIFAKRLTRCDHAIAFGAHFSVHPALTAFDTRSPELRAQIATWDVENAVDELVPYVRYDLFYGAEDALDAQHAAPFRSCGKPNVAVRMIGEAGHNVAGHLKERGLLYAMLDELIWQKAATPIA